MRVLRLTLVAIVAVFAIGTSARAQLWGFSTAKGVNHKLSGRVVDYTHNSLGHDHRLFSPMLGQKRDLYVYLPPCYDPNKSYPLLVYFHVARTDEHEMIGSTWLVEMDRLIAAGQFPPTIVICPDGTVSGKNRYFGDHSFYLNGVSGRFEDHVLYEVIPFVTSRYSIRPERQAHAILGVSGGGLGGLSIAMRHREYFGAVATLAAPANLLYSNCHDDILEDFSPATYRWATRYDPREVVGKFTFGLAIRRARRYARPVFGDDPAEVYARTAAVNPASLIEATNLQPGELAIYLHYAGRDGYNFDAQIQSFAWLAAQKGIAVETPSFPEANHTLTYFRQAHTPALAWLAGQLLGPAVR